VIGMLHFRNVHRYASAASPKAWMAAFAAMTGVGAGIAGEGGVAG